MLWFVAAAAGLLASAGGAAGEASAEELLAQALEVIDWQSARIDELVSQNEELRELAGDQAARLAEANETLAVLQRMAFGRKSEKDRPEPPAGAGIRGSAAALGRRR